MDIGDAVESVVKVSVSKNSGHVIRAVRLAIAGGKMVFVVKVVIYLHVELPAVRSTQNDLVKIGAAGSSVIDGGLRIKIDDFLADRVNEIGVDQIRDCEVLAIPVAVYIERIKNLLLDRLADRATLGRVGTENEGIAKIAAALRFLRLPAVLAALWLLKAFPGEELLIFGAV